jgi:hypothetical protein
MASTTQTDAGEIESGVVYEIAYTCDTPDPDDIEEGTVQGYWTGDVDHWGKLTIEPANGQPTLYLFPREILIAERVGPRHNCQAEDTRWHAGFADVDPIAYRNLGRAE